jgi:Alcohol dehydrogenase, class IV
MVNKMILNETSYHGKGAILSIPTEIKTRGYKRVAVVTDKSLM